MTGHRPLGELADRCGGYLQRLAANERLSRLGVSFTRDVAAVLQVLQTSGEAGVDVYAYWPARAERAVLARVILDDTIPRIVTIRTAADLDALLVQIAISDVGGDFGDPGQWPYLEAFIQMQADDIGSPTGVRYATPDARVLKTVIRMATWPKIPVLRGTAEVPFFRTDRTVCAEEGFDVASGWYGVTAYEGHAASPAGVIAAFARRKGIWKGSALELLVEEEETLEAALGRPVTPRWLASALEEMTPALAAAGIGCRRLGLDPRTRRQIWEINASNASDPSYRVLTSGNVAKGLAATGRDPSGQEDTDRAR